MKCKLKRYIYTALAILMFYPLEWILSEKLRIYTNPTTETVVTMGVFFTAAVFRMMVTLILIPVIFSKLEKKNFRELFRINKVSLKQVGYALVVMIFYNGIVLAIVNFQNKLGWTYEMNDYFSPKTLGGITVFVVFGGIMIPMAEELFFRGMLIRGGEKAGIHFSIIMSACYFALIHDNPARLPTLFVFGYLTGFICYYSNSIIPSAVCHMLTNSLAFLSVALVQIGTGMDNPEMRMVKISGESFWTSIPVSLVIGVVSAGVCRVYIKKLKSISPERSIKIKEALDRESLLGRGLIISAFAATVIMFLINN